MMPDQTDATHNFYALLIACDFYFPNLLPRGGQFRHLGGCVRDIKRVEEELLIGRLKVPRANILKLTSSVKGDAAEPAEPPEERPTYDNIVKKFEELVNLAGAGDQVYIHYSGHGGRIRTRFPQLKGEDEVDETLVPIDIADKSTRYVRDIDLGYILKKLVDKGAVVTLVLDSCHSGGATRNANSEDVAIRTAVGGDVIDDTPERPADSKFASDEELIAAWQNLSGGGTRNAAAGGGWLPEPEGYVLLAACRPSETALEYAFNGTDKNGVLSYWLMDVYKQLGPQLTWKLAHDRIIAKVYSQFPSQTPQLQGDTGRVVFGVENIPPQYAVNVMEVETGGERIRLNTGQALGVTTGAEFAIFPAGAADFKRAEERVAMAKIDDLGAVESLAKITEEFGSAEVEPGAQAVLVDALRMRRKVRLLSEEPHLTDEDRAAFKALEQSIKEIGRGFIELGGVPEAVEYQVGIGENKVFEILDPQGAPFSNLPAVPASGESQARQLAEQLAQLSKYHTVQQLHNYEALSRLAGKLKVELSRVPAGYKRGDRPDPQPLDAPGNTPVIKDGDLLFLHIKNESSQVLNIAVLDLQPDWGISQFYPPVAYGDFIPVEAGKDIWVVTDFFLPGKLTEGTDVLKVFGTVGPANFRWLELKAFDDPSRTEVRSATRSSPRNQLEQLVAEISAEEATTRNARPSISASDEWIVTEVSVTVKKN